MSIVFSSVTQTRVLYEKVQRLFDFSFQIKREDISPHLDETSRLDTMES